MPGLVLTLTKSGSEGPRDYLAWANGFLGTKSHDSQSAGPGAAIVAAENCANAGLGPTPELVSQKLDAGPPVFECVLQVMILMKLYFEGCWPRVWRRLFGTG